MSDGVLLTNNALFVTITYKPISIFGGIYLKLAFIDIFLIGVGLAMDAFAVSICKGLKMKKIQKLNAVIIAFFFGAFQAIMPLIGYYLGSAFEKYITSFDHWVAFILLAIIGGKMIKDSFSKEKEDEEKKDDKEKIDLKELTVMAVATSIDALAVGITFAFSEVNIFSAISIIGATTFVICIIGVLIGNFFGIKYKSKAELVGGIILILIGLKILLTDLGVL
ncbi:MAG: manganese efflux pump MntP family protein [Clostridiales bacterium]|nr:manganese efflux pump MntP family protein [Clostridiales bacterium]